MLNGAILKGLYDAGIQKTATFDGEKAYMLWVSKKPQHMLSFFFLVLFPIYCWVYKKPQQMMFFLLVPDHNISISNQQI